MRGFAKSEPSLDEASSSSRRPQRRPPQKTRIFGSAPERWLKAFRFDAQQVATVRSPNLVDIGPGQIWRMSGASGQSGPNFDRFRPVGQCRSGFD